MLKRWSLLVGLGLGVMGLTTQAHADQEQLLNDYRTTLIKQTYKTISYPQRAIKRGYEGRVTLSVKVNRNGALEGLEFNEESEHEVLNNAAAKAVRKAKYPEAPAGLKGDTFDMKMPIKFKLPS